jgi:putative lipase involved disintegration of autophagic bodies
VAEATFGDGKEATVSFSNTGLTNITVEVDSTSRNDRLGDPPASAVPCRRGRLARFST